MGHTTGGHFIFLHGLEQSRLRFGRGTIDLIGQKDVGKNRSFDKTEGSLLTSPFFFQDIGSRDIGRHQVRGKLDPVEIQFHYAGQR